MIKFAIVSRDAKTYEQYIENQMLNGASCIFIGDKPNQRVFDEAAVLMSEPDLASQFIHQCKKLAWLQSTWAGNNALNAIDKRDYILTACKGIFAAQMREYAFAYILHHQRRIQDFIALQAQHSWEQLAVGTISGKTLGIMGMGSIGVEVAKLAQAFKMTVIAITHSNKPLDKLDYFQLNQKIAFAHRSDFVLNLLPETDSTKAVIDSAFLEAMPNTGLLINAGRGSALESDKVLYDALVTRQIGAAVLDVFAQEPLSKDSLLYRAPRCYISNHTAANSQPEQVFDVFSQNLDRYIHGEALLYQHDFTRGY